MKNKIRLLLTSTIAALVSLFIVHRPASAISLGDNQFRATKVSSLSEIASQIDARKQAYLQKNNTTNIHDLPQNELYALLIESQDIKKTNNDVYQRILDQQNNNILNDSPLSDRSTWNWAGKIFLTMDSTSLFIFNHGHAGIASTTIDATIEANSNTGVKKMSGSNYGYWDRKRCRRKYHNIPGAVYGVLNTDWGRHLSAASFASNQIGKGYSILNDGDVKFYCSELAYRAWQVAGKTISYSSPLWGYMVLPADLMLSPDTYIVEDWSSWNNPSYPNGNSCANS